MISTLVDVTAGSCLSEPSEFASGVDLAGCSVATAWDVQGVSAGAQGGGGRGLNNADVVHDGCQSARVVVRGTVNGRPCVVDRAVRKWGLPSPQKGS